MNSRAAERNLSPWLPTPQASEPSWKGCTTSPRRCARRVEEGLDATDDPAVWVWAMIEDDDVDADTLRLLKAMARNVVRDATGIWAYILIPAPTRQFVTG